MMVMVTVIAITMELMVSVSVMVAMMVGVHHTLFLRVFSIRQLSSHLPSNPVDTITPLGKGENKDGFLLGMLIGPTQT